MKRSIQSIVTVGSTGFIVEIECQLSNSLPSIVIVGLGNKAVDEAKERIRSAFASSDLKLPRKRIIINLAPADLPKESTSLDLAIVAAILEAGGQTKVHLDSAKLIIGEVGLTGVVRPVRGIIGKLLVAKKLGVKQFFIPYENLQQALLIPGITITPVRHVKELFAHLTGQEPLNVHDSSTGQSLKVNAAPEHTLSSIAGQERAKRALEIAAAGGHNLLLYGPPGTGKSMLAKALPSLLPPMSHQEVLDVTHLHSLASNNYEELVTNRPFRSPHHSASHISVVGGGARAQPGEITLSHRGVLLLDEMPEFDRKTLEALRQPLEDNIVTVSRARHSIEYPADFILVATANPCPCGFYGSSNRSCECTPLQIQRYQQKLSGPILDRIDMYIEVGAVAHDQLLKTVADPKQDALQRNRVAAARKTQHVRFGQEMLNARMKNRDIVRSALLSSDAQKLLDAAAERLAISARGYLRTIKVARTIADLESSAQITSAHISEALQYRSIRSEYHTSN